jgi:MFS transporter, SP family, solute carrier family 2 (myo-inositol transporter), member 13
MDSPQAPLIAGRREDEFEYEAEDAATDTASNASRTPDAKPGVFVLLLTFAAGISGLLFGCKSLQRYTCQGRK